MSERPTIRKIEDTETHERTGFSYNILVSEHDGHGLTVIVGEIFPGGESPSKKMISTYRTYTITDGEGEFLVDGQEYAVEADTVIVIPPNSTYSFKAGPGGMKVTEVNIFTDQHNFGDPLYELVRQEQ